jgi:hypothetical protein
LDGGGLEGGRSGAGAGAIGLLDEAEFAAGAHDVFDLRVFVFEEGFHFAVGLRFAVGEPLVEFLDVVGGGVGGGVGGLGDGDVDGGLFVGSVCGVS